MDPPAPILPCQAILQPPPFLIPRFAVATSASTAASSYSSAHCVASSAAGLSQSHAAALLPDILDRWAAQSLLYDYARFNSSAGESSGCRTGRTADCLDYINVRVAQ